MLRIQNISLRKRLLAANFTMVFVPLCVLVLLAVILFVGLRLTAGQDNNLMTLWPEKGPTMGIQYTISSLKVEADKGNKSKAKDFAEDCRVLESLGITTAVIRDDQPVYITPGGEWRQLQSAVGKKSGGQHTAMIWDDDGFYFSYLSPRSGTQILAAGNVPLLAKGGIREGTAKNLLRTAAVLILLIAVAVILFMGFYLSRLLSRQILTPLAELRAVSAEIRRGNLDCAIGLTGNDEIGETCRDFDIMRQELKSARERQQKYEQNRRELIAGISHDLSTPLTLLKGYASGILNGVASTAEKRLRYTELIYQNSCTLEKLVDSLFLFSKLDLGGIAFQHELVDLIRYFEDFSTETSSLYAERGLYLSFTADCTAAPVYIDRIQFQRVVENLLENCLKYKETEYTSMEILGTVHGQSAELSFRDHGCGVPEEALNKLFDSFYRTDRARTDVKKGSGLGLAITKQIITAMGGTIRAAATIGGGLTIIITLPLAEEDIHEKNTDH